MAIVQQFARQIFEGINFLHESMNITHTDLKVIIFNFILSNHLFFIFSLRICY